MLKAFAGGTIFGESYGEHAPRVLALHGWRRTHADFAEVLAGGPDSPIDAIALDLPGFGATPAPGTAWGSCDYAHAVAPVLDEMADQVVVVGHSFGGRVALALGLIAPERISALVLTGVPLVTTSSSPRQHPSYRIIRALAKVGVVGPDRLEAARRRYGSSDYRAAEGVMREVLVKVLGERYEDAVAELRAPVTLVWGEHDTTAPIAGARVAAHLFANSLFIEIAGGHHLTPTESPAVLRDALLARLE